MTPNNGQLHSGGTPTRGSAAPISMRGYFDYHFVSMEPTRASRVVTDFDRQAVRVVWGQDEDGHRAALDPVPNWRVLKGVSPVMQYVICDGEGVIVERIPVVGPRYFQCLLAMRRIMHYVNART